MPEKIPCPVDGCEEVFDDEAAAIAHMKDVHKDEFSAPVPKMPPVDPDEPPEPDPQKNPDDRPVDLDAALAMLPPGMLKLLDSRMDSRIQAALEAERPQIKEAVTGAIKQVIDQARAAGLPIPGVTVNPAGEGGVVPGSPVTSEGLELIKLLRGGGGSQMEDLAKTLTQARAISDVLNPPTIWDRVMQNAVLRSLSKAGLVTDAELKELTEKPPKG